MFSQKFICIPILFLIGTFFSIYPALAQSQCRILLFGDSLIAGYGLEETDTFPKMLERTFQEQNLAVEVINGGVSGDTTSSGFSRIEWALAEAVDLVIVELGANDMLRGLPNVQTEQNLRKILTFIQESNIPVILAGMRALPNLGASYALEFDAIYPALAAELAIPLYPFFLDGVAGIFPLNQEDGIHPNKAGNQEITKRFAPMIRLELEKHCTLI